MPLPRDAPSRRATNASAGMAGIRPTGGGSAIARPGVRQTAKRASTARHAPGSSSSLSAVMAASRIGRAGAVSPAESLMSVATNATHGTKRKERDFEAAAAAAAAADGSGGKGAGSAGRDSVAASLADETSITVVVRCRGRNEREVRENSAVVVNTDGAKGKVVELMMGPNALSNKTYNFDRVFSPAADQGMVFDDVVKPILDEMLSGFNCTIFAYGQTGTGKTYTMSGDMSESLGLLTDAAGIIPRVLQSLFNKLDADESDSIVRCSFIELYNEELRDLLSPDADNGGTGGSSKLKIYDDNSRKGHATTVVQGMEERHIGSAADGIKRLQEGSLRRQVAATKCNDLSSRSHTVFTITVQTKHVTETGEDFYNTGKLNLVDLAGSENIQRSGAENKRAAEAGLINKSLLTLGRVINALVDRTAHVPYRESKLTRLLQDSLGGRTKTCIIATISTAKSNLEETISTLDYAFRAKNIRNKPQINLLLSKKTLLREFTAEIEKLKSELIATRQRNGVYLSNESYEEMTVQSESRRILAEEQAAKIETMENNLRHKLQELLDLTSNFMGLKKEHEGAKAALDETKGVLDQTELVLAATRQTLAEETHVRQAHQATEEKLATVGSDLIATLKRTVSDIDGLRAKNRRKSDLQGVNRNTWAGSQAHVSDVTRLVEARILDLRASQDQHISSVSQRMHAFVEAGQQSVAAAQTLLDANLASFEASKDALMTEHDVSRHGMASVLDEMHAVRESIQEHVGASLQTIATAAERIADDVLSELSTFHNQLHASYSTLGKDFKGLFEDLRKHMDAQRAESDRLRKQVEDARQAAVRFNTDVSAQIQQAIDEERRRAAEERQQLLAQIGSLITNQADAQASRLDAKAAALRACIAQTSTSLEVDLEVYSQGMDAWNTSADGFVQDMNKSRDALKSKLQEDWTAANEHSTSIQRTTQSVNAETVRAVDKQKKDLATQMDQIDALVGRASSLAEDHHSRNGTHVGAMADAVATAFSGLSRHTSETVDRAQILKEESEVDTKGLRDSWESAPETLCQPLSDLRARVASTALREYVPTGDTPEKAQYRYPLDLPRTAPHEVLVARLHGKDDRSHDGGNVDAGCLDDYDDELQDSMPTPSRLATGSDNSRTTTVPVVFNDFDATATAGFVGRASSQPPSSGQLSSSSTDTSLREVNPNLTTGSILFDPGASTMSLVAAKGSGGHTGTGMEEPSGGDTGVKSNGGGGSSSDQDHHSHTMPLFRRSTRQQQPHQPPPAKQAKTRGSMMAFEGRENVPPLAFSQTYAQSFSQSLSRRRSPRLN